MKQNKIIIAIDGPAGSGKSSTAKQVAGKLNIGFLDTGAMYRALAYKFYQHNIDPADIEMVRQVVEDTNITLQFHNTESTVLLDGVEVNREIRSPEVNRLVPVVAAIPVARRLMVAVQQKIGRSQSVVAEGRDIGTVVFPKADLKIFMNASLEERAHRRYLEQKQNNIEQSLVEIMNEIQQRDEIDSKREIAPLKKAEDAIELDTSELTLEEQTNFIVSLVKDLPGIKKVINWKMIIQIDSDAGVCPGVRRAIRMAEDALSKGDKIVAVGPLIHNRLENERLSTRGLEIAPQDEFEKNNHWAPKYTNVKYLIRTHGISPVLRNQFEEKSCQIIDATCPKVRRSQRLIESFSQDGYQIVIVGKAAHPEVVALVGASLTVPSVILKPEELGRIDLNKKIMVIAQTTTNRQNFHTIIDYLRNNTNELLVKDTICNAVSDRHQLLQTFASQFDVVFFVGGRNSSNTKELYKICRDVNINTYLIESYPEIDPQWLNKAERVGISGSASTPRWQLERIQSFLQHNY